ncbi:hypothetical protein GCM10027612_74720 [Microbispora bryophytorum subsp. camponoti]
MDDADGVRHGQPEQRALEHGERGLGTGRALRAEHRAQRDAVDELHDDGGAARGLDVLVEARRVRAGIHGGEQAGLVPEPGHEVEVRHHVVGQVLDRHRDVVGVMTREHHSPGAPRAELTNFRIAGDAPGARLAVHNGLSPHRLGPPPNDETEV